MGHHLGRVYCPSDIEISYVSSSVKVVVCSVAIKTISLTQDSHLSPLLPIMSYSLSVLPSLDTSAWLSLKLCFSSCNCSLVWSGNTAKTVHAEVRKLQLRLSRHSSLLSSTLAFQIFIIRMRLSFCSTETAGKMWQHQVLEKRHRCHQ